jgi:hypothetical protein
MPIKKHKDLFIDLTIFTCEGQILFQDIIDAMKRFYDGIDGPPTTMVLWDLSQASTGNLSVEELDDIARFRIENKAQMGIGKTAIVASTDLDFGMVRMFQAKSTGTPRSLMVFRTLDEARQWIKKE